jgi:hypothetical protein
MASSRANRQRPPRLKVGQQVTVRMAGETVHAVITEDRGTIGAGGRRLWRVRLAGAASAQEPPLELEVPADRLTPTAPPRTIARPRRASRHAASSPVR